MKTKRCRTCGTEKDRALFNRNAKAKDGQHSECRLCQHRRFAMWKQKQMAA